MTVRSILSSKGNDVVTAAPASSVAEIANILADRKIGAIVMTDSANHVVGIISERDVVREIARRGAEILQEKADAVMTRKVVTCKPEHTINEVMQLMTGGKFRHLPVVENGKLTGIVSIGDVVKVRIQQAEKEADAIREYIATA